LRRICPLVNFLLGSKQFGFIEKAVFIVGTAKPTRYDTKKKQKKGVTPPD